MRISTIIPNYNRAATIGATIESMLRQTLPPYEIIVVDDGSTDDSCNVIRSFGEHVTLVQQENRGPGAARNTGLKQASGEFIQFMDSDDIASLNKLEAQAKTIAQHKADIVYGPWVKVWFSQKSVRLQDVVLQQKALPPHRSPLLWFLTSWSMVFQQCLVRRSVLERVGNYREDMHLYEDGELFVRMLSAGATLVHEAESLTLYRLEDHGKLTASGSKNSRKVIDKGCFYLHIASIVNQSSHSQAFWEHPDVRLNVWRTLADLEKINSGNDSLMHDIRNLLPHSYTFQQRMRLLDWIDKKRRGVQSRLKGHRWPSCYQSDLLTKNQVHLITELGYTYESSPNIY